MTPLRIALVAGMRFPIAEPFAGGMESQTWLLARGLRERGHDVTVFAGHGSDPTVARLEVLDDRPLEISTTARSDTSMPPDAFMREHHAYLRLMIRLASEPQRFDVVHNNSLHYLPVAMAAMLPCRTVTTLHTPPTPWLESAVSAGSTSAFVAVSEHTAARWAGSIAVERVIHNGIDLDRWRAGPGGGGYVVWSGRLVPEKSPHLAVDAAAAAGVKIVLAGPSGDPGYVRDAVQRRLGEHARWVGHLDHAALATLVGAADAAVVTPSWDEPYGLVVAEALACGTPVAAFARGAVPEIVDASCAVLAEPGDVGALAEAMRAASLLRRADARNHAERWCSAARMLDEYEQLYAEVA